MTSLSESHFCVQGRVERREKGVSKTWGIVIIQLINWLSSPPGALMVRSWGHTRSRLACRCAGLHYEKVEPPVIIMYYTSGDNFSEYTSEEYFLAEELLSMARLTRFGSLGLWCPRRASWPVPRLRSFVICYKMAKSLKVKYLRGSRNGLNGFCSVEMEVFSDLS